MAKRMFNQKIMQDDVFLDMPMTSQALYLHLNLSADDDGFVSPRKIMRMIGAGDDDLKILVAKRYVLAFPSGVVAIKHWKIHNKIRRERHVVTLYKKELKSLTLNEYDAYTEIDKISAVVDKLSTTVPKLTEEVRQVSDKCQTSVRQMSAEVRLGKVRLGKDSNTTNVVLAKPKTASQDINRMFEIWEEVVGYRIQSRVKANRFACSNLLKKHGMDKLSQLINGVAQAQSEKYAPNITDFCSLQQKLTDLIVWGRKKGMTNAAAQF